MKKLALTIDFLLKNTPTSIKSKSKDYEAILKKSNGINWIYNVGDYIVRVKIPTISKMILKKLSEKEVKKLLSIKNRNVLVSCTCNFWKYNGPDFNAATNNYSERFLSDLSDPQVRDPQHKKIICKHVYATLKKLKQDLIN